MAAQINEQLPEGYFAESMGRNCVELDEIGDDLAFASSVCPDSAWRCPEPIQSAPCNLSPGRNDIVIRAEGSIVSVAGALVLVGAGQKDREAYRDEILSKCAAYLQEGAGLLLVDVLNDREESLHEQLLRRLEFRSKAPSRTSLCAASYRPVDRYNMAHLDIWQEELEIGKALPILPLWLLGKICLRIDLGATYDQTCREQRIPALAD